MGLPIPAGPPSQWTVKRGRRRASFAVVADAGRNGPASPLRSHTRFPSAGDGRTGVSRPARRRRVHGTRGTTVFGSSRGGPTQALRPRPVAPGTPHTLARGPSGTEERRLQLPLQDGAPPLVAGSAPENRPSSILQSCGGSPPQTRAVVAWDRHAAKSCRRLAEVGELSVDVCSTLHLLLKLLAQVDSATPALVGGDVVAHAPPSGAVLVLGHGRASETVSRPLGSPYCDLQGTVRVVANLVATDRPRHTVPQNSLEQLS